MSARKRTKKKTGSQPRAVTQVVDVKVVKTKKQIILKQRLERGHWLPRPLDAATIVDRQSLREMVTLRLQQRPDAWKSLKKLVSLRRDKEYLLDTLATLLLTNTSGSGFKATFGRPNREIQAVMRRMLRCADDIDRLPANVWGDRRSQVSSLPTLLRTAADLLRTAAMKKRKRGRQQYDAALAAIVHYVRGTETEKRPHNSDVANIVAAMRGDEYSEEAHKNWLKKHQSLVLNPGAPE